LEDWEKKAVIDFHLSYPLEDYRRLALMMLDRDMVGQRLVKPYEESRLSLLGNYPALSCISADKKTARPGLDSETGCWSGN
jgi:hypothetical protein